MSHAPGLWPCDDDDGAPGGEWDGGLTQGSPPSSTVVECNLTWDGHVRLVCVRACVRALHLCALMDTQTTKSTIFGSARVLDAVNHFRLS